jgi:hypothetical protein
VPTIRYMLWSLTLVATGFIGGWGAHGTVAVHAQARRPLSLTHIFTATDGQTRAEQIDLALTQSTKPPDRGTLESALAIRAKQVQIVRTSPDYVADFHSVSTWAGRIANFPSIFEFAIDTKGKRTSDEDQAGRTRRDLF